jgi:hypothetical protein
VFNDFACGCLARGVQCIYAQFDDFTVKNALRAGSMFPGK